MFSRSLFAIGIIGIIAMSASTAIASAADSGPLNDIVKLTVPVHLKELPRDVTQFMIQCSFRYVGGTHGVYGPGPESSMPLAGTPVNGAWDGNISITLTRTTTPPSKINGYFCTLSLYAQADGTQLAGPASVNGVTTTNLYNAKSGTTFSPYVEGSF